MGSECQTLGPTAPRPRQPLLDRGRHCLARVHSLTAAVSPLPRHRHPQPLVAIKGAHPHRGSPFLPPPPFTPTAPPFLSLLSRCGQPALASLRLIRPCPEHRAAVYNLPAQRAVDHHPRTPPPPSFPSGRPHLIVEHVLPVNSSFPPPQNTLPPCSPDPPHYTSSSGAAGIWPGRHQRRRGRAPSHASPRWATSPSGWASPKQADQFQPVCTVQPAIFRCD
jgi:hypothetical protein